MDVDEWLAGYQNPMAPVVAAVRDVIMGDDRISETIKYRAPAFEFGGIMAYFHWNAKAYASLIFPKGSELADHPRLLGDGLQRTMRFHDVDEVADAADDLLAVVDEWCELRAPFVVD